MSVDASLVAKGLEARLADVDATIRRHRAFAFGPADPPPPARGAGDPLALARDLVRRALTAVADATNDRLLRRLADGDATLAELAAVADVPYGVVWERVHDLVQVGLAGHDLDGDRAGLTGAGAALVELVDELASRTAEQRR
jgi:hypothetical protein